MKPLLRRAIALTTAPIILVGGLAAGVAPALAVDPALADATVLDLSFDGDLADSGPRASSVSMFSGDAAFEPGVRGQALALSSTTAVDLGTSASLQPSSLTASFWFKPSGTMAGEQVFSWSKTVYNSDGWYLTSADDATPLALSVGPGGGQPYQIAVEAPRAEFFPADAWTHVVVTYDEATKSAQFYRNGERQVSTVRFPATGEATGVITGEDTSTKTLGFNGPVYNGAHLSGLLDDYRLFSAPASVSDVVALTRENDPAFDPASVAQRALDALSLPATAVSTFTLPGTSANGSEITWTSSDESVIAIDGDEARVTQPETTEASTVLTATATYGGSEPRTRTFTVAVPVAGEDGSIYVDDSELDEVLLEDPYLVNGNQKMVDYLLTLDPERFLTGFYTQAGLPATAEAYGGWERTTGARFQGHFFGHFMSALSQAYASSTDPAQKAALLEKLTAAVDGLERTQTAYADTDPANAGYVSPFPVTALPHGADGLIVPFYNLHKVLAGLLDAHEYAPSEVSEKALRVADGFGSWLQGWASRQADPGAMLNTEYGGMNEALYRLYEITENPAHKRAAEYFDEVSLFRELAAGKDVLNGRHANTTIPKLIGALKRYTVFTDNPRLFAQLSQGEKDELGMYRAAAENFWQMVVDHHSYANGGNSQSEHFHGADTLHEHATNGVTSGYGENSTSEVCNEYNMLKLTRGLFQVDPNVKYPDFYEHTYINTILAQQNPETGMMTYFQPMAAGYAKVFGEPEDEFWCDHGTATESFTKLGDSIYFRKDSSVYVTMFRSSVFTDADHNLTLTQTANVPADPEVRFTVAATDGGEVEEGTTLRLRIPGWVSGTPTLSINGEDQDVAALTDAGFLVVPVSAGDEIAYTLPAAVTVDDGTENPNWVAFRYGPVLLATELNRNNVDADYLAGILVRMSTADKSVNDNIVVADADAWKADIAENLVRLEDGADANGTLTMRFGLKNADAESEALVFRPWYSLYDARYAIYMNLVEPDSAEAQALILAQKEQLRTAETTIDSLTSFDNNNSEADKNYRFNKSSTGIWRGQGYRDAQAAGDAWFQYDMIVDPDAPRNYLGVRYFGGDDGRTFDVYLNDVKLKSERITNAAGADTWYVQYDEIPAAVLADIEERDSYKRNQNGDYVLDADGEKVPVVTVRFQSNGQSFVGGVYGVYTRTTTAYDTSADLAGLDVDGGTLSPALADGVLEYTVTVPETAETVELDADPAVPSGLIYIDGVLIDDTKSRTIPLAPTGDDTVVALRSVAQDHVTAKEYRITIVRGEEPEPGATVGAVVSGPAENAAGWRPGRVEVALTVAGPEDAGAEYRIGTGSWTEYTEPFAVTEDGVTTVDYRAVVDGEAVDGSSGSVDVRIDANAPITKVVIDPKDAVGSVDEPVRVTASAVDAASGVAAVQYHLGDGEWTVFPSDGLLFETVGATVVSYRAIDVAGNTETERSFLVSVLSHETPGSLTVGSSTIRAGESFTVSGGGFSAGERVEFALFSTPRALGGVIADASGSFTATLVLPRDVAAGDHTLRAVGSSSGVSAEAPVTVLAAADGAAPAPAPGSDDDGPLAVTGADIGGSLVAALLLLAVGAFLVIRRRRAQTGPAQDDARGHGRLVDR
jgi:DUF1680 family protein